MAQPDTSPIGIISIEGRDGSDSSFVIPEGQCLEAMNIDWFQSSLARKRGGASNFSLTSAGTAFASGAVAIARHVPGDDQTAAEFWSIDGAKEFHRLAGSATWASPTVLDACSATPQEMAFQSFNGKLYLGYKNAHNRLHCWDGSTVRRVGFDQPAVVTGFALAGGAVTDTRKYRIAWTKQVSGVTVLRSNLSVASASQAIAAQQVTVTRTTAPGEGETHWELYGASTPTFADYRLVATTIIATTTAVDNAALTGDVSPDDGANTPPGSWRYLAADDARIIGGGTYEAVANQENATIPKNNRVWWTSILGSSDVGDDERVSLTGDINNYADVEEAITAISQPIQVISAESSSLERGSFYVFSFQGQWKFVATGEAEAPYLKFRVSQGSGCIHHKSLLVAFDHNGDVALYWASVDGPMRITRNGQEFLGQDVIDLWDTINLDATIPCHTVYVPQKRQVWFYIATGSSLYPDTKLVFDTALGRMTEVEGVRKGWSVHGGESAKAYCSALFSDSVGATMGRKLKPYIGYRESTAIWKCDTEDTDDAGNLFQAYLDTRSYAPWGLGKLGGLVDDVTLVANPSEGVTLQLLVYRNEGQETLPSTADLTDQSGQAAKVFPRFENSKLTDSFSFRCRIGDAQAIASAWNLDALVVPITPQGR